MTRALVGGVLLALGVSMLSAAPATGARPNTTIKAGPSGLVASRTVTFKFTSTATAATFECKLDSGSWSTCKSPKRYSSLAQGPHTFRVRARKAGKVDKSPARQRFRVDTVKPHTTILSGPAGVSNDYTPSFTFSSSESGTFTCRFNSAAFTACSSPFNPPPKGDNLYTFQVRAKDKAGNVDGSPASQQFEILTPITQDQATAEEAAELYFPDTVDMDVPATCGGIPAVDCPGGVPTPATGQVRAASTRSVIEQVGEDSYDVTVTSDVSMVAGQVIQVSIPGAECDLTFDSDPGVEPTWQVDMPLDFVADVTTGELRIEPGDPTITDLENDDWSLAGPFLCTIFDPGAGFALDIYQSTLEAHIQDVGNPLCAATGPAYLGPCPPP